MPVSGDVISKSFCVILIILLVTAICVYAGLQRTLFAFAPQICWFKSNCIRNAIERFIHEFAFLRLSASA